MIELLLKLFIWLNNFSYKIISSLVVRAHNGLHPKHRILDYHKFFTDNISESDTVLDIGCGNGAVAYDLSRKAAKVTGIDIKPNNISIAKKRFANDNLDYIVGDAAQLASNEKFDVITLSNVLEHIENRVELLSKIKNIAPKILIRVPLLTRDWLSVYKKEIGLEYRLDNTHFIEYTEENFKQEATKAGLTIESYYTKFGELYSIIK